MPPLPSPHHHLKAWRLKSGLSQQEVGDILGLDKSQVHRWETGKRKLKLDDLRRLAALYGIPLFALLMAPDDIELAKTLAEVQKILAASPPDAVSTWLEMGKIMAAAGLSSPSND